ncbi:MAG: LytR C-terminal domain-containing protein [Fibromonadaceae bacterium]|nr:LytR C-terminal domain-containing protein [Fibromonadaceae bacterium]
MSNLTLKMCIAVHQACRSWGLHRKLLFPFLFLLFIACEEDKVKQPVHVGPVPGKIEIFNSCGISGAASDAKDILRGYGFDVLEARTDPQWSNYEETIIAIRNPHWQGNSALKSVLNTKNFIVLQDAQSGIVDATIFLGRDYMKVLRQK